MKNIKFLPAVLLSVMLVTGAKAQDEEPTGLPGDNFSLQGALEMFKKAANPEQFEKLLNTKANGVNNLDLNTDGKTDCIRVVNKKDGNTQIFVLQAVVSDKESQDVAVINLEKTGDSQAVIQIVGDEDIYGTQTIIEPSQDDATAFNNYAPAAHGPNAELNSAAGLVVNVWFWPSVRYVYAPAYVIWESPWHWYHYPTWWDPWSPLAWHYYRPIRYRYVPHYAICHTHRIYRAPVIYQPVRRYSTSVRRRNEVVVRNYRAERNYTPRYDAPGRSYGNSRPDNRNGAVNGRNGNRNWDRDNANADRPRRDMNRGVDRGREPNRNNNTVDGPRRDVNRGENRGRDNNTVDMPRRDVNRNAPAVERPRGREMDRTNTNTERPRGREMDRTNTNTERPRGREMNRTRTEMPQQPRQAPQMQQRAPRQAPQMQQRSNPGVNRQSRPAPSRDINRETNSRRRG